MGKTKVLEIDGARYQIGKMGASEGSYIHWRILGALLAQQQDGQREQTEDERRQADAVGDEEKAKMLVTLGLMRGLTFEDTQFAQRAALRVVSRLEWAGNAEHPMPIVTADGRFVPAELGEDAALVSLLTVESLAFNLAPFFSKSRSAS